MALPATPFSATETVGRFGAQETKRVVEEAGRMAVLVASDLSTEAGCKSAVAAAADQFGRIDVLVNNAAFQVSVAQCSIPPDSLSCPRWLLLRPWDGDW